jgi:hypothetical protein
MKKLILIQNDYSGAGKTTLSRCIIRYLKQHKAHHQTVVLSDNEADAEGAQAWIDPSSLSVRDLVSHLDAAPITILEVSSGLGDQFCKFYQAHELQDLLHELGVEMTAVIPVTSETDSHESVIQAAETFSDNAQYVIAHLITSSYEDDDHLWDRSYAARVMDMFEAVELHIPELGFQVEHMLRAQHNDLAGALLEENPHEAYGKDFTKWYNRVEGQIDSARQYLFGDEFKPVYTPTPKKRGRKPAIA